MEKYASYSVVQRKFLTEQQKSATVNFAAAKSATNKTFLAHSSADVGILPNVIAILEEHGADVYIDKKDSSLPRYTSPQTANALRSHIRASKRFIVLATPNSKTSTWVPWELGLADGIRGESSVATFPIVSDADSTWPGREYYGLYHRIIHDDDPRLLGWWVKPPFGTSIRLRAWLSS